MSETNEDCAQHCKHISLNERNQELQEVHKDCHHNADQRERGASNNTHLESDEDNADQ